MKLIKGVLAIAIISLIAVSCNETKKDTEQDSIDAVEANQEAVSDAVDTAGKEIKSVEADADKAIGMQTPVVGCAEGDFENLSQLFVIRGGFNQCLGRRGMAFQQFERIVHE